jgi:hypothetical protein
MDPLTLLRELFGEEPIRKVITSGFDSVHKIAAATPESLSFFSGINEVMARQIVASAEESLSGPSAAAYRDSLTGSAEEESPRAVRPRVPPSTRSPVAREDKARLGLLDEDPLLDAGGILKTVAKEPRPREFMEDEDLLDGMGLSDAEADFLEGISPWPGGSPRSEKSSPAPAGPLASSAPREAPQEREIEYAPISDWSPEKDPDPVPRLVRARELGGAPPSFETQQRVVEIAAVSGRSDAGAGASAPSPSAGIESSTAASPGPEEPPPDAPSFWKFGK